MERGINMFLLEVRRPGFYKITVPSLVVYMLFILIMLLLLDHFFDMGSISLNETFLRFFPFLLVVNNCFILTQEFTNHTDKIIFTGIYNRTEIIVSKLFAIGLQSLILYLLYMVVTWLFLESSTKYTGIDWLQTGYVFLLHGIMLGTFILFFSVVTGNGMITGVITYVLFFNLIHELLKQAIYSVDSQLLRTVIELSPFYAATSGFYMLKYTASQSLSLWMFSGLLLVLTCFLLNKRNI